MRLAGLLNVALRWADYRQACPDRAAMAEAAFDRFEVVVLGTVRHDGSPRLSLVEPRVIDGDLVVGMSSSDGKFADLRRDHRCELHALVDHRTHVEPAFRISAVAEELAGRHLAEVLAELARPEIRWAPTAAFALRPLRPD
jgi:hypothetical protein